MDSIPKHVGFIVDGNRRWAKEHSLPTLKGHTRGYELLKEVSLELLDFGVEVVSAYVFSIENWKRSEKEVSYLMNMVLKAAQKDLGWLVEKGVRIRFIGTREHLSPKIIKTINECEQKSAHCKNGTLALCFNYSGQQEIVDAHKKMVRAGEDPEKVTIDTQRQYLYSPDIPDIDIIVRISGEQRLSNFMLWRAAYSELLFLDTDMTKDDANVIISEYGRRQRRFGR